MSIVAPQNKVIRVDGKYASLNDFLTKHFGVKPCNTTRVRNHVLSINPKIQVEFRKLRGFQRKTPVVDAANLIDFVLAMEASRYGEKTRAKLQAFRDHARDILLAVYSLNAPALATAMNKLLDYYEGSEDGKKIAKFLGASPFHRVEQLNRVQNFLADPEHTRVRKGSKLDHIRLCKTALTALKEPTVGQFTYLGSRLSYLVLGRYPKHYKEFFGLKQTESSRDYFSYDQINIIRLAIEEVNRRLKERYDGQCTDAEFRLVVDEVCNLFRPIAKPYHNKSLLEIEPDDEAYIENRKRQLNVEKKYARNKRRAKKLRRHYQQQRIDVFCK